MATFGIGLVSRRATGSAASAVSDSATGCGGLAQGVRIGIRIGPERPGPGPRSHDQTERLHDARAERLAQQVVQRPALVEGHAAPAGPAALACCAGERGQVDR